MPLTLHVVDGDSTGGTLKLSGLAKKGHILNWRDALYTGPVLPELDLDHLSRVRSRFWTHGRSASEFEGRNAGLAKHKHYDNVVLWFGAGCVLCQLSLLQILTWFHEQGAPATRLSWVRQHGGELPPDQMEQAWSNRKPVTAKQMQVAGRVWYAFRQSSPAELGRLLNSDLAAVPGLRKALLGLLQEYPSRRNGLSRLETLLMRCIQRRDSIKASVAVGSVLARETVGDLWLFDMLRAFVRADYPLVEFAEPFEGKFQTYEFNRSVLRLTAVGRRVLAGKADAIALNGIDRWLGGVHLLGKKVHWRWDGAHRKLSQARY